MRLKILTALVSLGMKKPKIYVFNKNLHFYKKHKPKLFLDSQGSNFEFFQYILHRFDETNFLAGILTFVTYLFFNFSSWKHKFWNHILAFFWQKQPKFWKIVTLFPVHKSYEKRCGWIFRFVVFKKNYCCERYEILHKNGLLTH